MSAGSPRHRLVRPALVVLAFVVVGIGLGVLWAQVVWSPPQGRISAGTWYPVGEQALSAETGGTSSYVALAALGGLVLGLVSAWAATRAELLVLAAVVVGGTLAAWLMWQVGTALGPPDPDTLAAADGTRLPGALTVAGASPFLTLPTVALGVLTVALLALPSAGLDRSAPLGNRSA